MCIRDRRAAELAEHARLTPRETEILALVAQGKNGPAIMQELFIAEGTFKAHMSHIYEKCGVANRRDVYKRQIQRSAFHENR